MPADGTLVIRPTVTRPLNKHERAFNRALTNVQTLRVRLEEEKHRLDRALVFHAAEIRPRIARAIAFRAQLVRAIAPFLDDRRLKFGHRTVLRAILIEQLDDILAHVDLPDPDLQALFERLHGIAYAQAVQADLDEVRSGMAATFDELGIDVSLPELRAGMSEEDIAVAAAKLADGLRCAEEAQSDDERDCRKTKWELREEDRARRFAQMRKDSIGVVYKRLVKVLHPDLESDAAERQKKIRPLPESAWVEVEPAAVEVDRRGEVLSVAEARGFPLDAHDLAVQAFGDAISDRVLHEAQDAIEMAVDHSGDFLHRLEA
jgi:hypothetical protein